MAKLLFTNEIADKLISVISTMEELKTVSKGDLSKIPAPKLFKKFMPMVLVKPNGIKNEWANQNEQILSSTYSFKIYYIRDYDLEIQPEYLNIFEECVNEAEPIAELLLSNSTLGDFATENGKVTSTVCSDVRFDNANFEFFRELQIPAAITEIDYQVNFRTFSNKMRR